MLALLCLLALLPCGRDVPTSRWVCSWCADARSCRAFARRGGTAPCSLPSAGRSAAASLPLPAPDDRPLPPTAPQIKYCEPHDHFPTALINPGGDSAGAKP